MKKINIKKIAFILIFCFSTVFVFSPAVYASHNNDNNGTTESYGRGGKWVNIADIILAAGAAAGLIGLVIYLNKKGPNFSDKKVKKEKDEESEDEISALKEEVKELKSEIRKSKKEYKEDKKKEDYKAENTEENGWSVFKQEFEERDKNKKKDYKLRKGNKKINKKNSRVINDEEIKEIEEKIKALKNNESEETEEESENKIRQVDF